MLRKAKTKIAAITAILTICTVDAMASTSKLKEGGSLALGVICFFGFIAGVVMIINGFMKIRSGETEKAKLTLIAGFGVAAAGAIMGIFFTIMGLEAGKIDPSFEF